MFEMNRHNQQLDLPPGSGSVCEFIQWETLDNTVCTYSHWENCVTQTEFSDQTQAQMND